MKPLSIQIILFFATSFCFAQNEEEINPPSFSLGISACEMFSSSSNIRRYELKALEDGSYFNILNNHSSSGLIRISGESQFDYFYSKIEFGVRTEKNNLEAHNLQEYVLSGPGITTAYISKTRDLYLSEKQSSLISSIELGSYFLKKDRAFRIGLGLGIDFHKYFSIKYTGLNRLDIEQTNSWPSEGQISTSNSTHANGSKQWYYLISRIKIPIIAPKVTLSLSYRFYKNFSLSANAQIRFLSLKTRSKEPRLVLETPVGLGLHYHF